MKRIIFTVAGARSFPYDMLRYDCCYPRRTDDALNIAVYDGGTGSTFDSQPNRSIELVSVNNEITPARWRSFGWVVTKQETVR